MRTSTFNINFKLGTYRTTDYVTEAFGKCFFEITFTSNIPQVVDIACTAEGVGVSQAVHNNKCLFDLTWFRYIAPKYGTKALTLTINADGVKLFDVNYLLTSSKGEVEQPLKTFDFFGEKLPYKDFFRICPTQRTKHWTSVEMLNNCDTDNYLVVYAGNGHTETETTNGIIEVTDARNDGAHDDIFDIILVDLHGSRDAYVYKSTIEDATCADIELRITNRHGLRGAIGGKMQDVTEGGDVVQSNYSTFTPVGGVYEWQKQGATIKKEVFFDFEGNAELLDLLRDGCVYGQVEWYCEQSGEWLPCKIEENSLDNDPFKEQSVTLTLQQL